MPSSWTSSSSPISATSVFARCRITARVLRDRDVRMAVCAPQGVVAAVFSGGGVDRLISVYQTRAAALAALSD